MLYLEPLTQRIIGAGIEVHRVLGPGLLESCYEEALAIEFGERKIEFVRQPALTATYKSRVVGHFRPDFIVQGLVIVELKCVSHVDPVVQAQVLTYLRMTGLKVGLCMNFHHATLKEGIDRYAL
jgi:GxxExxY protein